MRLTRQREARDDKESGTASAIIYVRAIQAAGTRRKLSLGIEKKNRERKEVN